MYSPFPLPTADSNTSISNSSPPISYIPNSSAPMSGLVQSPQPAPAQSYVCLEDIDIYFAFCFPYTYEEMKRDMDCLDLVFSGSSGSDGAGNQMRDNIMSSHNIYYQRETMFILCFLFLFKKISRLFV
jgi:hypothetical protein